MIADKVESAVMDAYVTFAEQLRSPDDLSLCLVESIATELEARLDLTEQAAVLSAAAARLNVDPGKPTTTGPAAVELALSRPRMVGLLREYVYPEQGDRRPRTALLDGYDLSTRDGRLPLLPVLFELHRSGRGWAPVSVSVAESSSGAGWRIELATAGGEEQEEAYQSPRRYP